MRKELAHLLGLLIHTIIIGADQAEMVKFLPDGPVATHLTKISSARQL